MQIIAIGGKTAIFNLFLLRVELFYQPEWFENVQRLAEIVRRVPGSL